jgi:MATE family multidrug resistance protein
MRRDGFGDEVRSLLVLAGPIIVNQLGQVGMHTADTIMVGPLGATSLAAAGLGSALVSLVLIMGMGAIMGMAPLVSQAHGAGEEAECRRLYVQGSWFALLLSVPLALYCLFGRELSLVLGQDRAVAELTGAYLRSLALSLPPALLFVAARQYLEGTGHPAPPMVVTFVGLGLNIVGNRVLIYGIEGWVPALGLAGAGWATTLTRWAMLLAIVVFLVLHRGLNPLRGTAKPPHPATLRQVLRVGAPVGMQFGLEVGLFSFAAVMMGWLGAVELAAHQVTINIAATTFMFGLGASIAGSIRVGQHIGAGRVEAMRHAVLGTYVLAVGSMACWAAVFVLAAPRLIGIYTPHPEIIAVGSRLLLLAAAFQVFDAGQVAGMGVLRGAADTRVPMAVAAFGYWVVGLPIAYVLAFRAGLGAVGVWSGLSMALGAVAVLLAGRVRQVLWRGPVRRVAASGAMLGA